jgi:hypothetical protein
MRYRTRLVRFRNRKRVYREWPSTALVRVVPMRKPRTCRRYTAGAVHFDGTATIRPYELPGTGLGDRRTDGACFLSSGSRRITVAPTIHDLFGKPSEALLCHLNLLRIEQRPISILDNQKFHRYLKAVASGGVEFFPCHSVLVRCEQSLRRTHAAQFCNQCVEPRRSPAISTVTFVADPEHPSVKLVF